MKRIYISGPMTGHLNLNFPAFNAEAARLRSEGHEVVNPAEITTDADADWATCMRADIREMMSCDSIFMLPGWEKSRGAQLERHIAKQIGMTVMYALEVAA